MTGHTVSTVTGSPSWSHQDGMRVLSLQLRCSVVCHGDTASSASIRLRAALEHPDFASCPDRDPEPDAATRTARLRQVGSRLAPLHMLARIWHEWNPGPPPAVLKALTADNHYRTRHQPLHPTLSRP